MTLRRLAVTGCFLATAALAMSACQVRHVPAEPQKKVAVPTRTLPGKQAKPGKVVNLPPGKAKPGKPVPPGHGGTPLGQAKRGNPVPPGHGGTPPGQNKNAKVTPPGRDGQGKVNGQDKRNAALQGQKGKSKKGPAAPRGQAKQPGQPAQSTPQQPNRPAAAQKPPQAGGPGKSQAKAKPADAPWKGDQPKPQSEKKASAPLPPAKGKPTSLVNKPPKGEAADDAGTAQAQQSPPGAHGKSPGAVQGKVQDKGKGKQPI